MAFSLYSFSLDSLCLLPTPSSETFSDDLLTPSKSLNPLLLLLKKTPLSLTTLQHPSSTSKTNSHKSSCLPRNTHTSQRLRLKYSKSTSKTPKKINHYHLISANLPVTLKFISISNFLSISAIQIEIPPSKSYTQTFCHGFSFSLPNQRILLLSILKTISTKPKFHYDPNSTPNSNYLDPLGSAFKYLLHRDSITTPSHHNSKRRHTKNTPEGSQMDEQITRAISLMNLGMDDPPTVISTEAQVQAQHQSQHIIVVRRLHHIQNIHRLRDLLVDLWKLSDRSDAITQEDGTILTTFTNEIRMIDVFNSEPWTYKGWFLAIDLWTNRFEANYLEEIMLWVKIINVPGDYKHEAALMDIGKRIGVPVKAKLKENNWIVGAECHVQVRFNINSKLKFVQRIGFPPEPEPVTIYFVYDRLRNYCHRCGSILHTTQECPDNQIQAHPGNDPDHPDDGNAPGVVVTRPTVGQLRPRILHPHCSSLPPLLPTPSSSAVAAITPSPTPTRQSSPRDNIEIITGREATKTTEGTTTGISPPTNQDKQPIQDETLPDAASQVNSQDPTPLNVDDFPRLDIPLFTEDSLINLNQPWPEAFLHDNQGYLPTAALIPKQKAPTTKTNNESKDNSEPIEEHAAVDTPITSKTEGKKPVDDVVPLAPTKRKVRSKLVTRAVPAKSQKKLGYDAGNLKRKTPETSSSCTTRQVKAKANSPNPIIKDSNTPTADQENPTKTDTSTPATPKETPAEANNTSEGMVAPNKPPQEP